MKNIPFSSCQICGKSRFDKGESLWNTLIRIVHIKTLHTTMEICVCFDCAERYTLRQIIDNRNRGINDKEN